jgi:hypothetical protein
VIFRLHSQVLEYGIRPEPFHIVPVLDLSVSDGIVDAVAGTSRRSECFVSNKEVQIFSATFARQV